ncbi:MAG: long-chain fatty acid--CoA ligase, partial [Clostridia bacterium]|nr:long-chain fatty acid--CoA ligase [Clostridia bacterium]
MTKTFYDVREIKDLRDLISQSAKLYADRPAFEVKNNQGELYEITYKQYFNEIQAVGTALTDMGLAGEKIAVSGDNSYEWCLS